VSAIHDSISVAFQVHFEIGDVTRRNYKPNSFDVIYSKEVFLHVADQQSLIKSCYVSSIHVSDLQTSCNKVVVKSISGYVRTACSQLL
jgi:2-polyprenyl-3-methyl-5-hydroxy-6-metoxy-1,4-benzoquinol methylase